MRKEIQSKLFARSARGSSNATLKMPEKPAIQAHGATKWWSALGRLTGEPSSRPWKILSSRASAASNAKLETSARKISAPLAASSNHSSLNSNDGSGSGFCAFKYGRQRLRACRAGHVFGRRRDLEA